MRLRWLAALTTVGLLAAQSITPTQDKNLGAYGCVDIVWSLSLAGKVCKVFDPETHKRFLVGISNGERGTGIALLAIDNEEPRR